MGCEAGPLFLFTGLTGEISFLAESWLYFPLFLHTDVIMALLLPSIIPRILLAGFTIFGRVPRQSCHPVLAVITFISFGIFCFLPLILDLGEEFAMKKSRSHVHSEMAVTYRQIYEELGNEMEGEQK